MQRVIEYFFPKQFEPFTALPNELQEHILSFLSIKDLHAFSCSSKRCASLSQRAWKSFGRELGLEADSSEVVSEALKLALTIEKLDFFPKEEFDTFAERYQYIQEQKSTPKFKEKLNAKVQEILKPFYQTGEISKETLSRVALFREIGADGVFGGFRLCSNLQWNDTLSKNPLFFDIIRTIGRFYDCDARRLFKSAFEAKDLRSCRILKDSIHKDSIHNVAPLSITITKGMAYKHLKLAVKLHREGAPLCVQLEPRSKVFDSAKFAVKWLALHGNRVFTDLKFPNNYFTKEEHFKVGEVFVKVGYKIPLHYLEAKIRRGEYKFLLPLISLYQSGPNRYTSIPIPIPAYPDNDAAFDDGMRLLDALSSLLADPGQKVCADYWLQTDGSGLTPIAKMIGHTFLTAGKGISSQTFQRAVDAEHIPLLKDLIGLYVDGFFIDYFFPADYFSKPIHFVIASLFVESGYRLSCAYLAQAIWNRDVEKIWLLAPLYQNQAPINIPIPPGLEIDELDALLEGLVPLIG